MEMAGFWMLALVGIGLVATGLPAFIVLIGVAVAFAALCVASTLGVVVPPSLVLILLGDTMLRAHSEAIDATGIMARAVNTQDLFRGALVPSAIFLALCFLLAWRVGRGARRDAAGAAAGDRLGAGGWLTGIVTLLVIPGLLPPVVSRPLPPVQHPSTRLL